MGLFSFLVLLVLGYDLSYSIRARLSTIDGGQQQSDLSPISKGKTNFEFWRVQMQLLFEYEDLWEIVDQGFVVPADQAGLTQDQRKRLADNRKEKKI